jgi:hypothetical protein
VVTKLGNHHYIEKCIEEDRKINESIIQIKDIVSSEDKTGSDKTW